MTSWKSAPEEAVRRLLTELRTLTWPLPGSESAAVLDRLGWRTTSTIPGAFLTDAGLGIDTKEASLILVGGGSEIGELNVRLVEKTAKDAPEGLAFLQEHFARYVAVGTEVLGPPTARLNGEHPAVRWRGEHATLALIRAQRLLYLRVKLNRILDAQDAQG